ncbi:MAG: SHOCT domain-containing protein [Acidimicrobiales bacterium]
MPFARRRPLLRAAAVGGVAYMGAKAGTNRAMQQQGGEAPPPEPTPPPPPAPAAQASGENDRIAQLKQLASLHESGALTDEEFAAAKAQVLA